MDERITVTIGDDQRADLDALVQRLCEAGMEVEQVLEEVGIVTGSVPESGRSRIEAVPGVISVEPETSYRLPPPESEIQ